MATIPRSFVDNFTKAVNALSDDAKEKLAKALEKVDASVTFDELLEIMEALLGPYTESAAAVAATFYDGLREWFGISDGFYAVSEGMRQPYITSGTVNKVMEGKSAVRLSDEMQMALLNQLDYEIRRTANITIERNAKRDPLKPKWARVPEVTVTTYAPWSKGRGVTHNKFLAMTGTCMFCTMLASRGFVYHSADTASHAHPDCNCRIVPSWDKNKPSVEGYDPDKYYDMWKHPEKYEKGETLAEKQAQVKTTARIGREKRKDIFTKYSDLTSQSSKLRRELIATKDESVRNAIKSKITAIDEQAKAVRGNLSTFELMIEDARTARGIEFIEPSKWGKKPTEQEIIDLVGGGDKTTGSCVSLSYAYFANKGGYVVRDFRGGKSLEFIANTRTTKELIKENGIVSNIESDYNAYKSSRAVLKNVEEGKQYIFDVAEHSAVVERREDGIYYLELQTEDKNGWHLLTDGALKDRFGCTKTKSVYGTKLEQEAVLIDGETLNQSDMFQELVGLINTEADKQMKGAGGRAK